FQAARSQGQGVLFAAQVVRSQRVRSRLLGRGTGGLGGAFQGGGAGGGVRGRVGGLAGGGQAVGQHDEQGQGDEQRGEQTQLHRRTPPLAPPRASVVRAGHGASVNRSTGPVTSWWIGQVGPGSTEGICAATSTR